MLRCPQCGFPCGRLRDGVCDTCYREAEESLAASMGLKKKTGKKAARIAELEAWLRCVVITYDTGGRLLAHEVEKIRAALKGGE